jgi:hypothetical protein
MKTFLGVMLTSAMLIVGTSTVTIASDPPGNLLRGNRHVTGTVEEVKGGQIKVNTGEVQPRFVPLNEAKDKGFASVNKGDKMEITLNDQNLIVDYHPAERPGSHRTIKGRVAQPLIIGRR